MRILRLTLPLVALLLACGPRASADELLPPGKPIEEVVDHYIDAVRLRPPPGPGIGPKEEEGQRRHPPPVAPEGVRGGPPRGRHLRRGAAPRREGPRQKGAGEFLKPRLADVDKLTSEVSSTFFGV